MFRTILAEPSSKKEANFGKEAALHKIGSGNAPILFYCPSEDRDLAAK